MNLDLLIRCLKKHIDNPVKSVVNSEGAFVAQSMRQEGDFESANEYWRWHCGFPREADKYGEEVLGLEKKIQEINKEVTVPTWGIYGT
jgi:hypothetical protein